MKNTQQGFIGVVLIIIAALAIGGGVYYHHKKQIQQEPTVQPETTATVEVQPETQPQKPKTVPAPKPTTLTFEAQARSMAESGACSKQGTITSFEGTIGRTDGGKTAIFKIISRTDQRDIARCFVDVDLNTSTVIYPAG